VLPAVEIRVETLVLGADRLDSGAVFVPLAGVRAEVVLAWRGPDRSPAVEVFATAVREITRDLDPAVGG
jgi:hypothetical protein